MTNPLYSFSPYYYHRNAFGDKAVQTDVYAGGVYPVFMLHSGTEVVIEHEAAVIMATYSKNALVRFHGSQECRMVSVHIEAEVLSYGGWQNAVPQTGTIVVVRAGEHQGKAGIIAEPGLNSAHVIFPGNTGVVKMSSKNLIVKPYGSIIV